MQSHGTISEHLNVVSFKFITPGYWANQGKAKKENNDVIPFKMHHFKLEP